MNWFNKKKRIPAINDVWTLPTSDPWEESADVVVVDTIPRWVRVQLVGGSRPWAVELDTFLMCYKFDDAKQRTNTEAT